MNDDRIGIVIVTWNNIETLDACLSSIRQQIRAPCKIIVVDNASSDSSATVAENHGADVIRNDTNLGFAQAANLGAARLCTPYILLLNPDTELVGEGCLATARNTLTSDPSIGTLGAKLQLADGTLQPSAFSSPRLWREIVESFYLYRFMPRQLRGRLLLGPHWNHEARREVGWLLGAFLLIPREVWTRLGGLTEDFHMFAEDLDWGRRVEAAGFSNVFEPACLVRHVSNHSGALRWGADRSEVSFRSYYAYLRTRHGPVRAVASQAVNGLGFGLRRLIYRGRSSISADPVVHAWAEEYRRLARFHFRSITSSGPSD